MMLNVVGCLSAIFQVVSSSTQCPDLVPASNMTLSQTSGSVGDPAVVITCHDDYKLDTDVLMKYIGCGIGGIWNDTVGTCVRKQCQDIGTYLPSTMTSATVTTFYVDDNVTVECISGYAFDVDMAQPVGSRVTSSKTISCNNAAGSLTGAWDPTGTCTEIECEDPPEITNSLRVYSDVKVGSAVQYQCQSGYMMSTSSSLLYSIGAVCNQSAVWESNLGESHNMSALTCYVGRNYLGCLASECISITQQSTSEGESASSCRDYCTTQGKRFAALANGTCNCGDNFNVTCTFDDDTECDAICPHLSLFTTESSESVFCGSEDGLKSSVYVIYEGCYQGITTVGVPTVNVTGSAENTCREHCRAGEFTHAGERNVTCYCLNITDIDGNKVNEGACDGNSVSYMYVHDTAKKWVTANTCETLFEKGIRMSGSYYLNNPRRKEYCNFKDGTPCDSGWVGYNGYCYYTNMDTLMDFMEARDFCHNNDAELVSILSKDEQDFINEYREFFTDIWGDTKEKYWWLGMADDRNSSLFMWVDGNLMTYANFKAGKPDNSENQCAIENEDGWQDDDCSKTAYNVMCKKEAGWSNCIDLTTISNQIITIDPMMTLTFCMEMCKGEALQYALVQNDTCSCTDTEPLGTMVPVSQCLTQCPGHMYQDCGGNLNIHTYVNVSGHGLARSCDELHLIGIGQNVSMLQSDTTPVLAQCGIPQCPYSWLAVGSHCYKAHLSTQTVQGAFKTCAEEDSYTVAIETEDEISELLEALSTISIYSGQAKWRIGLRAQSVNGGLYRLPNGRKVDPSLWSNNFTHLAGSDVVVHTTNNQTWHAVSSHKDVFLCEKGQDYIGCYTPLEATNLVGNGIYDYSLMTIQLCVEVCRAEGAYYAFLNQTSCECGTSLTDIISGLCDQHCIGQTNQVCGGDGLMSVYNISMYPPIAEKCEDLFDEGIFLSRQYVVDGTLTQCDLIDGTQCDFDWIGYNGNCYRHFPTGSSTRSEVCKAEGATQTSLASVEEYGIITDYIKRIPFSSASRVFSGITKGDYDLEVYMSEDGLLVDPDLVVSDTIASEDLFDDQGYVSFRIDKEVNLNHDGGVICKKNKYVLGCFDKPNVTPVLENFNSVELTLCKQLCAAQERNMTLIGNDFCICSSLLELPSLTAAGGSCDIPCQIHKDQSCGDGSVIWAYQTTGGDTPLAQNCSTLYRAGIFYKALYLLEDGGTVRFEQCGYTDTTSCPPTWFGHQGECYRFSTFNLDYAAAAETCFGYDGYLFNPINTSHHAFIDDVIATSGLLNGMTTWQAGIMPIFYNATFVTSNGAIVATDFSNETNKPEVNSAYESKTGVWIESNTNLPYICQRNKAFHGCQLIASNADANYSSYWNSLTMCIQWCFGLDMKYAATNSRTCQCFSNLPTMVSYPGNCTIACDGATSQPCGGVLSDGTKLHTVIEIENKTSVVTSCAELYNYSVIQPGQYYVRNASGSELINVNCFGEGGPYGTIDDIHVVNADGSTRTSGFWLSYISFKFPLTNVWKPKFGDSSPYAKLSYDGPYIITGILTAGISSSEELSYVQSYTLHYKEALTDQEVTYSEAGTSELSPECDAVFGFCYLYLSHPVVTSEITIRPISWHHSIALQGLAYGQNFSEFNHSNKYMGCFLDIDGSLVTSGTVMDLEECTEYCHQNSYAFASIDENDECRCGSSGIQHGQVTDDNCPTHGNSLYPISQNNMRPIFRTYEAHCPDPPYTQLLHGNVSHVHYPYQDSLFTYGTQVTYTCDKGYEFTDGSDDDVISCQQNNEWTNLTKTCQIISCPTFNVTSGNVTFTSLEYQANATVTCEAGNWAENSLDTMTVQCEGNKSWTITPTCSEYNRKSVQTQYDVMLNTRRDMTSMLEEVQSRSKVECAAMCTGNYNCRGANFKQTSTGSDTGACRLFDSEASGTELSSENDWLYFEN